MCHVMEHKSRVTTDEPQQVATTRLLHCLQYRVPHLSRLQRIHPRAYFKLPFRAKPTRPFRQAGRWPHDTIQEQPGLYSYSSKMCEGRHRPVLAWILT